MLQKNKEISELRRRYTHMENLVNRLSIKPTMVDKSTQTPADWSNLDADSLPESQQETAEHVEKCEQENKEMEKEEKEKEREREPEKEKEEKGKENGEPIQNGGYENKAFDSGYC